MLVPKKKKKKKNPSYKIVNNQKFKIWTRLFEGHNPLIHRRVMLQVKILQKNWRLDICNYQPLNLPVYFG